MGWQLDWQLGWRLTWETEMSEKSAEEIRNEMADTKRIWDKIAKIVNGGEKNHDDDVKKLEEIFGLFDKKNGEKENV